MSNPEKWTKPNRLTRVTKTEIERCVAGEGTGLSISFLRETPFDDLSKVEEGDTVWQLWTTMKTGLDKETKGLQWFASREAAENAAKLFSVGTQWGEGFGYPGRFMDTLDGRDRDAIRHLFRAGDWSDVTHACHEAFESAGVATGLPRSPTEKVIEWVGQQHVEWMQSAYGEGWEYVAILEYCTNHFPVSSLVHLAAQLFVAVYVSDDRFTAGYVTKEIELVLGGAEEMAVRAGEIRKKAGNAGGKASSAKRTKNLNLLIEEIETLSSAVGLMSEARILDQAFEGAQSKHADFPKSSKTRFDYETTLRSEEQFKSRYEAVFRGSA